MLCPRCLYIIRQVLTREDRWSLGKLKHLDDFKVCFEFPGIMISRSCFLCTLLLRKCQHFGMDVQRPLTFRKVWRHRIPAGRTVAGSRASQARCVRVVAWTKVLTGELFYDDLSKSYQFWIEEGGSQYSSFHVGVIFSPFKGDRVLLVTHRTY